MHPPSRKDFVSLTLSEASGSINYNNSKQWRRQSCWRKWKQLSRLQRSLILFALVLLLVCWLSTYPVVTDQLQGLNVGDVEKVEDKEGDLGLKPLVPKVLAEPGKQERPPQLETSSEKQKRLSRKRGPPVLQHRLQKKGNGSDTQAEEHQGPEVKKGEGKVENGEEKGENWQGAMVDAKDPGKVAENKSDSPAEEEDRLSQESAMRLEAVKEAFRHAWKGYKEFAWGHDELRPISKSYGEWFGLGLTLIDALDTMWILGLKEEFEEAKTWVSTELSFNKNVDVNLFESTIRILGGLLSTYHLTGEAVFLDKAKDIGSRLMPAFSTPSKIPYSDVNIGKGTAHPPRWTSDSTVAEVTSIQLEFRELSRLTDDDRYQAAVGEVMKQVHKLEGKQDGLVPMFINTNSGQFTHQGVFTLGARADSYYEYLLKQWIQGGKKETESVWVPLFSPLLSEVDSHPSCLELSQTRR